MVVFMVAWCWVPLWTHWDWIGSETAMTSMALLPVLPGCVDTQGNYCAGVGLGLGASVGGLDASWWESGVLTYVCMCVYAVAMRCAGCGVMLCPRQDARAESSLSYGKCRVSCLPALSLRLTPTVGSFSSSSAPSLYGRHHARGLVLLASSQQSRRASAGSRPPGKGRRVQIAEMHLLHGSMTGM